MYVPIWSISLDAPQYPEGLSLTISANGIGGDVDIINGLNHYIGMKKLDNADFIEFSILRYIIAFYALFALIAALLSSKKILYTLFTLFVIFGVVAMVDFWRWEYNYGHDLNPDAAIIVPGMAYQPPLIGFKQLLNFGAYSIPAIGGWLFISSGVLMLIAVLKETNILSKFKKNKAASLLSLLAISTVLSSCASKGPEAINLNKDNCNNCKMTIADARFACELVTEKGRVYKFDDMACMVAFKKENTDKVNNALIFVSDYVKPNLLKSVDALTFIVGENVGSPMGGNYAGFSNKDSATFYESNLSAKIITWNSINQ